MSCGEISIVLSFWGSWLRIEMFLFRTSWVPFTTLLMLHNGDVNVLVYNCVISDTFWNPSKMGRCICDVYFQNLMKCKKEEV
jgi:hypothetical protein